MQVHRAIAPFVSLLMAAVAVKGSADAAEPGSPRPAPVSPVESLAYDAPFFPGADHDPEIPSPESILGFPVGQRAAESDAIERCFRAWADASPRMRIFNYATSHEGRTLFYAVVTSPENMERLEEIKSGLDRLADPRQTSRREADDLLGELPAVAWMAYSIHGDETSGADAATALAHHLVADRTRSTHDLLDATVVIIDPNMNPDGRDRFLRQIQQHAGVAPSLDDQSLPHAGRWPWGRTNHYLFDLNRDWILGVHPETRGRLGAVDEWNPVLFVDCHEMGSQDTYLFSPSREPVNAFLPEGRLEWWDTFAADMAAAFDRFGWPYYSGEWNEEWYPGYSSSWAGFRGAVGILYEQAGIALDAVRRPEGTLMTYRESVHHQVVASAANLRTLHENKDDLMRGFVEERRRAASDDGPFAGHHFLIAATENRARMRAFLDLMTLQGFEVGQLESETTFEGVVDQLGRTREQVTLPAGSLVISNQQPEGHLIAAMLTFDPHMTEAFLQRERREVLRTGGSLLYDVTAWSTTLLHDLEAYELTATELPASPKPAAAPETEAGITDRDPLVGWVIDAPDDNSVAAAAHLMERGVEVRLADRAFTFDGSDFARGSVVIARNDNRRFDGDLADVVDAVAKDFNLRAVGVSTGQSPGVDVPDIGGEHFLLLKQPRIAILSGMPFSPYSFGAAWWTIDHRLGLRASYIDAQSANRADLRRYNTIVLPDLYGDAPADLIERLDDWTESGGTLIAIGDAAAALTAGEEDGERFSAVRPFEDVLTDLSDYKLAALREWHARHTDVVPEWVWSHRIGVNLNWPLRDHEESDATDEQKKQRDDWRKLFMPQGAILAARTDDRHWLTSGLRDHTPVVFSGRNVLMSKPPIETAMRLGVIVDGPTRMEDRRNRNNGSSPRDPFNPNEHFKTESAGWSLIPEGADLHLRMSGLLWPEAAWRLANTAWLTREAKGDGQIILFASEPNFRGATRGSGRAFMNAAVYGAGAGARHPILP